LSMTREGLHQARQALIQLGLVAYQRPLSQVLALDAAPRGATLSGVGFFRKPSLCSRLYAP
jgi:hypothetical protein